MTFAKQQGSALPTQAAARPIDPGVRVGHVHLRTADMSFGDLDPDDLLKASEPPV